MRASGLERHSGLSNQVQSHWRSRTAMHTCTQTLVAYKCAHIQNKEEELLGSTVGISKCKLETCPCYITCNIK